VLRNPKYDYIFLRHVTSILSGRTIFYLPTAILNHFDSKIVSAQRNTHSLKLVYTVLQNNCFRGNFYMSIENLMRVLGPFLFHIKAWGRMTLHKIDHPMSFLPQNVFHFKSYRNSSVGRCSKYPTHQEIQGNRVPQFSILGLSGTFLKNNSGTIPFVFKYQEKSWKHRFL